MGYKSAQEKVLTTPNSRSSESEKSAPAQNKQQRDSLSRLVQCLAELDSKKLSADLQHTARTMPATAQTIENTRPAMKVYQTFEKVGLCLQHHVSNFQMTLEPKLLKFSFTDPDSKKIHEQELKMNIEVKCDADSYSHSQQGREYIIEMEKTEHEYSESRPFALKLPTDFNKCKFDEDEEIKDSGMGMGGMENMDFMRMMQQQGGMGGMDMPGDADNDEIPNFDDDSEDDSAEKKDEGDSAEKKSENGAVDNAEPQAATAA